MSKVFAVYGASGCGRSLMPVAVDQLQRLDDQENSQIVFIDDALVEDTNVNGYTAMNYAKFKSIDSEDKFVLIAIANSSIRQKIAAQLVQDGISLWTVKGTTTLIMDEVSIAAGAALSPFVTIAANVTIGKCFHANLYSYVEHDCVIEDFVHISPKASLAGNITVKKGAHIGLGANIIQGVTVGENALIGAGTVVLRDVPPNAIVVGNPGRIIKMKEEHAAI